MFNLSLLLALTAQASVFPAPNLDRFRCESREASAPTVALTLGEGIYGSANGIKVSGQVAGIAVAYGEGLEGALSPDGSVLAVATASPFRPLRQSVDKNHHIRTLFSVATEGLRAQGRGEASLEITIMKASSALNAITVKALYLCERAN